MRPRGTRKPYSLTKRDKSRILALTRAGVKQIEIARDLKLSVDTVRDTQRAAGLKLWRELTPDLEREAVALLRLGHGQYRVSRMTRVPQKKIHKLLAKYRIHHPVGQPCLPAAKHASILERVMNREDFGVGIGKKEGVSRSTVLEIAHKIYGPGRFRGHGEPLTSAQNADVDVERNTEKFLETLFHRQVAAEAGAMHYENIWREFLEGYLTRAYQGVLPPDHAALLSEVMDLAFPASMTKAIPDILTLKGEVAACLKSAIDSIGNQQSRWTN
jgi:hypothetical protein